MILRTKRLTLRPLCMDDLETVHEYASDEENTKYMLFLSYKTERETREFLSEVEREWRQEHPNFYEFAVVLDGAHIGAVTLYILDEPGLGELGWVLNKKYWNQGYASEAASAVLEFAKGLRLHKVIAQCDYRNIPSARVMEKLGMKLIDDKGERLYERRGERARELTYGIDI